MTTINNEMIKDFLTSPKKAFYNNQDLFIKSIEMKKK